jgi:hypothetical protein
MKTFLFVVLLAGSIFTSQAVATGLATCDSGDPKEWQSKETLQQKLEAKGWEVRRVKEDGGCWEVYARNAEGERVEAYFHPVTLEPVKIEEDHKH